VKQIRNSNIEIRNTFKFTIPKTPGDSQDNLEDRTNEFSRVALNDPFETFDFGILDVFRISSVWNVKTRKSVHYVFAQFLGACPRLPMVARGCCFETDVSIVWGE